MKLISVLAISALLFSCKEKSSQNVQHIESNKEQLMIDEIKKYPDSALLQENLMEYYKENENYDKAIAIANNALVKDSLNPRLYDIKGILELSKGDTLAAIHSYEKALEIIPEPSYVIALGTMYAQTRNPKALEMADALLIATKAKADRPAYFIKGLYYQYSGQKQKAIEFFDKCLDISYTDLDAYLEKGIAQYDLGLYKESISTFEKSTKVQINFADAYYYTGRSLEKLNRSKDAVEAYQTALMYDPNYLEPREALNRLGIRN